jgi:hypothetical protein
LKGLCGELRSRETRDAGRLLELRAVNSREIKVKVRIGIAETGKVVEFEVDDPKAFEASVEDAFSGGTALLWFEDSKQRRVGFPRERLGFVEIETEATPHTVGFSG